MTSKKTKPASAWQGNSTGSEVVRSSLALNASIDSSSASRLQQAFVARRFRLAPSVVRLTASLAFGSAA